MKKTRLEAFTDGVVAIIITIMVLELKAPLSGDIHQLKPLLPVFLSYLLSFIYVGIYWNNHHHMFLLVNTITGGVLWANLNLLFWLSLVPFVTEWMGNSHFSQWPVAVYGMVLIMTALSYTLLYWLLASHCGKNSELYEAIGQDWKGRVSLLIYATAIAGTYFDSRIGLALYGVVAIIWFIPDRRVERKVTGAHKADE